MTTYNNPEILPGVKNVPNPGDTIVKFNRYYLCINPAPNLGPPTWRVSQPDEYPCDGAVLPPPGLGNAVAAEAPIVVTGDNNGITYDFSMDGVPLIGTTGKQVITRVAYLSEAVVLSNRNNDPVSSAYDSNDETTVTTFDIDKLEYEQIRRSNSMVVNVYNRNKSGFVTANNPVQSADNADSTDLFFDIDSLPHES